MNRRDFNRRLADMHEREYEIDKELKNIHLKLIMEDDRERKQWFINVQDRLNQEKKELGNKILDL
mgnify:CR=1 FL=1